jgi:hypothetical protein
MIEAFPHRDNLILRLLVLAIVVVYLCEIVIANYLEIRLRIR